MLYNINGMFHVKEYESYTSSTNDINICSFWKNQFNDGAILTVLACIGWIRISKY